MRSVWITFSVTLALSSPAIAQVANSGPILRSERETTQTSRTVAAEEYRDAYCAKWTDGCSVCQRTIANEQPECRTAPGRQAACEKKTIQCQALLRTVRRVCLSYSDGCNRCSAGACTAMACMTRLPDGTSRPTDTDWQCIVPRHERYDEPQWLELDLRGHWRVIDPQGRSCEIVIHRSVSLSAKCTELGAPVTEVEKAKTSNSIFQLVGFDGDPVLSFDTSDLESLKGTGQSSGFRLVRLDAEPLDFSQWEGHWTLDSGSVCDLFLSMRARRISPHVEVKAPAEVSFASNCLNPDDDGSIRFKNLQPAPIPPELKSNRRTLFLVERPILLPRWRSWQVEGHDITFYDERGRATTFKPDREGTLTTELAQDRNPPLIVHLKPQRR
jgi:hypothetical protein